MSSRSALPIGAFHANPQYPSNPTLREPVAFLDRYFTVLGHINRESDTNEIE